MKRFFASLLSLVLLFTAVPTTAIAAGESEQPETEVREVSEEEMNRIMEEDREHINDKVTVTDEVYEIRFPVTTVAQTRAGVTIGYHGKANYHGYEVGIFTINGETAFCMQHNKYNPPNGTSGTENPYDNEDIRRVLYYGMEGSEPWSGFESETHARVLTSLALSYYYYGLPTMDEGDYIFTTGKLRKFLDYCESHDVPDDDISLSKSKTEAYLTENRKEQRTEEITLNGFEKNSITFKLPSGVTLHNVSTGKSGTGDVKVNGGQSFYFTAPLTQTGTWNTGTMQGSMKKFQTILTEPVGNYQKLGRGGWRDPQSTVSLSVKWLDRGNIVLEKGDRETDSLQGEASFAGAVYDVFKKDSYKDGDTAESPSHVTDITLGADGRGVSEPVLLGSYIIKERTAPKGYQLDTTAYEAALPSAEENPLEVHVAVKDSVIRGGVYIEKWDRELNANRPQGGASLNGGTLEIISRNPNPVVVGGKTYQNNETVATLTLDQNGHAKTAEDLLPYGHYQVREKTPPAGYLNTGDTVRDFYIREHGVVVKLNTAETAIRNNIIRGGVYVEKWDNETGQHKPQGAATLEGAVFEILNRSSHAVIVNGKTYQPGTVVTTLVTDKDGGAKTAEKLLPYGHYEVREKTPPNGYVNSGQITRAFDITSDGQTVKLNTADTAVRNNPVRGDVEIIKLAENQDEDEDTIQGLAGVEFTFTSKTTGKVVKKIVTDKNGYATTADKAHPEGSLVFDTYVVTETKTPEGFKTIEPFEVTIREHGVTLKGIYKEDKLILSPLTIVKTDATTGRIIPVKNTEFRLLDKDKQPVTMTTHYPETVVHETFFTNEKGQFTFPEKLKYGTYYLEEVNAPHGYLRGELLKLEVTEGSTWENPLVVKYADAPAKGRIRLLKVDKTTQKPIPAGAEFDVIARADIVTPDGTVRAKKGEVVDHIVTDGMSEAESKELFLGKYLIRETKSVDGYLLNKKEVKVTLKYKDQNTPVVFGEATAENAPAKGRIRIKKYDGTTEKLIPAGAEFEIRAKEDIVTPDGTVRLKQGELADTVTVEKDGRAVSKKLFLGSYTVTETKAPEGYLVNEESFDVRLAYQDQETPVVMQTVKVADSPAMGRIRLHKADEETKQSLVGAEFEIRAKRDIVTPDGTVRLKEGALAGTLRTDAKGEAVSEELFLGTYTVKETKQPQGFVLPETAQKVELAYKDQNTPVVNVSVECTNRPTELLVIKEDESGKPLPGVTFRIWNKAMLPEGEPGTEPETEETDAAMGVIQEYRTDRDGRISIKYLSPGTYCVQEVKADGYLVDSTVHELVIGANGRGKTEEKAVLKLQNKPNEVVLRKTETGSDKPLAGISYQIWNKGVVEGIDGGMAAFPEYRTDDRGEIRLERLVPGTYCVQETKTLSGYVLDRRIYEFTVSGDGLVEGEERFIMELANDYTKVQLSKQTLTGKKELPGAHMELLVAETEAVIDKWTSTDKPHLIERLQPGTYILKETKAPRGYKKAERITFEVKETGKLQTVVMYDEELPREVIKTGDMANPLIYGAICAGTVILAAAAYKRRRKK